MPVWQPSTETISYRPQELVLLRRDSICIWCTPPSSHHHTYTYKCVHTHSKTHMHTHIHMHACQIHALHAFLCKFQGPVVDWTVCSAAHSDLATTPGWLSVRISLNIDHSWMAGHCSYSWSCLLLAPWPWGTWHERLSGEYCWVLSFRPSSFPYSKKSVCLNRGKIRRNLFYKL